MSFFGLFGIGKKNGGGSSGRGKKCYIVDCAMMESSKGERTRMGPRNQLDLLRRLSRFVKKEQVDLWAVFDGKELRDAPDGKKYMDVTVCYAARAEDVPQTIAKMCAGGKAGGTLVITSDKVVEKAAQQKGALLMHCSTFRKALESDGGGSFVGGDRSSNRDRSSGRRGGRSGPSGPRRPPRSGGQGDGSDRGPDRRPNREEDEASVQSTEEKVSSRPPRNDSEDVSDLIDLV